MRPIIDTTYIQANDRIVIAVSGGVDSMVLFANLVSLRPKYHLNLVVCHVNHQVREASKAEYAFVEAQCALHNVAFYGMHLVRSTTGNFHDDARDQRYRFFAQIANQTSATKIAIAHQADDQTETVMMRLVRGSSFAGYAGMDALSDYQGIGIIRPLLNVTRKTIERYQKAHEVPFVEDESNHSTHYTRNRFRHNVLPLLMKENPQLHKEIGRYAIRMGEAAKLIHRLAEDFIKANVSDALGTLSFSRQTFALLDAAIQREVLKRLYDWIQNNQSELAFPNEQTMLKIVASQKPHQTVSLPHGIAFKTEYDTVTLGKDTIVQTAFTFVITKPGTYVLPNGDSVIIAPITAQRDDFTLPLWYNNEDMLWPLSVRTRVAGDRIRLEFGTKKINDLLIDRKIPKSDRDSVVVLTDSAGEILWIPGIRSSMLYQQGEYGLSIHYKRG